MVFGRRLESSNGCAANIGWAWKSRWHLDERAASRGEREIPKVVLLESTSSIPHGNHAWSISVAQRMYFCRQMEQQSMLFWLATASFDVYVVNRFSPELIEWWMERPRARTLQSMRARVILGIWISGGSIIEIEIMREVQEDPCRWGTCETGWWNLATDVFGQPVKPFE